MFPPKKPASAASDPVVAAHQKFHGAMSANLDKAHKAVAGADGGNRKTPVGAEADKTGRCCAGSDGGHDHRDDSGGANKVDDHDMDSKGPDSDSGSGPDSD